MSAKAAFLLRPLGEQENKPVLGVHRDALVSKGGGQGLFRVEKGKAEWVPVSDPKFLGDYLMVESLVENGDRIVIKPPSGIKSGDRVEISE
jgi:hypothetical protein